MYITRLGGSVVLIMLSKVSGPSLIIILVMLITEIFLGLLLWFKGRKELSSLYKSFNNIFIKVDYISDVVEDKILNNTKGKLTDLLYSKYYRVDLRNNEDRVIWRYLNYSVTVISDEYFRVKNVGKISELEEKVEKTLLESNSEEEYFKTFQEGFSKSLGKVKYETYQEFKLQVKTFIGEDPSIEDFKDNLSLYVKHFFGVYCDRVLSIYNDYKRTKKIKEKGSYDSGLEIISKKDLREKVINFITEGEAGLTKAIKTIKNNKELIENDSYKELAQLEGTFNEYLRKKRVGILQENDQTTYEKVKNSLLYFIYKLD